jgi:hypothetical protein
LFKKLSNIVFAVAFLASGWNNAVAAALCPHQECMGRFATQQQHAAHEVEAPSKDGCSKGVEHSEHASQESPAGASTHEHSAYLFTGAGGNKHSCTHCMDAPATPVRNGFGGESSQARRDAEQQVEPSAASALASGVAAFPALRPTQGSPPTPPRRRHLLINVFLI